MADTLAPRVRPWIEAGDPAPFAGPRGGEVRSQDLDRGRLVPGRSHPFVEPDHLMLTNGLLRVFLGVADAVPTARVWAFAQDAWRDKGDLVVSPGTLTRARVPRLTTDAATVALEVTGGVEVVLLTLLRGERMLRITSGRASSPSISRSVRWAGATHGSSITSGRRFEATSANGTTQAPDAWGLVRALLSLRADITGASGLELARVGSSVEMAAAVTTQTTRDDVADHQRQFAAEQEQRLAVRGD